MSSESTPVPTAQQIAAAQTAFNLPVPISLGGFENAVYSAGPKRILRLTHVRHRRRADVDGELEWLLFASERGARACRPFAAGGRFTFAVGPFTAAAFERAGGAVITEHDWHDDLFTRWGAALGQLHRIAAHFQPRFPRWHWQDDANFAFDRRIPADQVVIRQRAQALRASLHRLPVSAAIYGLIHADAHPGNFHVDPANPGQPGAIHLFDFDDCHYNWFAFDLASAVFSASLQPWLPANQRAREAAAARFFPPFASGYAKEFPLADWTLTQLPHFLKLREYSQYAVIHAYFDVAAQSSAGWESEPFVARFMAGRRARMEAGLPFLDLDFRRLSTRHPPG